MKVSDVIRALELVPKDFEITCWKSEENVDFNPHAIVLNAKDKTITFQDDPYEITVVDNLLFEEIVD